MSLLDTARQILNTAVGSAAKGAPEVNSAKKSKRKAKISPGAKLPAIIEEYQQVARANGYKSVKVSRLLNCFGYQKRSAANMQRIANELANHNLTIHPPLTMALKLDDCVRLHRFPVLQLGDLFEDENQPVVKGARRQRERDLESHIERNNLFHLLGLKDKFKRQHSPQFTSDRFDFLCEDEQGHPVVLELKHGGGGKSAVEQVLRYIGMLKTPNAPHQPKGILVTGFLDVDTAKAFHGMTQEQRQEIKWFLYKYVKATGELTFKEVDYNDVAQSLQACA